MLALWNSMALYSGHIISIQNQPVFALSPYCCMLSREPTNTNFIILGLTRPDIEPHDLPHSSEAITLTITPPKWLLLGFFFYQLVLTCKLHCIAALWTLMRQFSFNLDITMWDHSVNDNRVQLVHLNVSGHKCIWTKNEAIGAWRTINIKFKISLLLYNRKIKGSEMFLN